MAVWGAGDGRKTPAETACRAEAAKRAGSGSAEDDGRHTVGFLDRRAARVPRSGPRRREGRPRVQGTPAQAALGARPGTSAQRPARRLALALRSLDRLG